LGKDLHFFDGFFQQCFVQMTNSYQVWKFSTFFSYGYFCSIRAFLVGSHKDVGDQIWHAIDSQNTMGHGTI
jgi:hypothetical protein